MKETTEKIIEGMQKPTWTVGCPPSDLSDLLDALKRIRSIALDHPCLDLEKFEQRDLDGLTEEGGDICDWTMLAIISDDALKTVGLGI